MSEKEKLEKWLNFFGSKSFGILEFEENRKKLEQEIPGNDEWVESLSAEEKELAQRLMMRAFYSRIFAYENSINRWEKGLWLPNEEELKLLKEFQEVFDTKIIPQYDEIKQNFSPIGVEENKVAAKEAKKTLDKLLEKDKQRQKAEDLLKKYKDNSPFSDDKNAESQFNEQITNLQNQIKDLENKQNQDSSLEKDHKYKQELERLKAELEKLKGKNKQKTSPTSPEKKNDNFSYGLVIGGVVLVVVLLLVFFFVFFHKRTNK